MAWPRADGDWAPYLPAVRACYRELCAAISRHAPVLLLSATPEATAQELAHLGTGRLRVWASSQIELIKEGIEQGRIKAVIALQENLVEDADFSAELLGKLDFLLTSYPLANPTADVAHVVLPSAGWAEKSGTMINVTGRLQRLNKVIDGPGLTLEAWEIVRDLIQATGGGNGIYSVTDIFTQLTQEVSEFEGLTWGQIGDLGIPLIETGETIPLLEREKERVARGLIVG